MDAAAERKRTRYADLLARCSTTHQAHLTTIEVGSRGFLNVASFEKLYSHLRHTKQRERMELEAEIVRKVITESHDIWCKRNWLG